MASTSEAVRKGPLKWLGTRRRRAGAAVGALVLAGALTIAVTTHSSSPTPAAKQAANEATTTPTEAPLVITPGVATSTVPPTASSQSPIAVSTPTVVSTPNTTRPLSPPAGAKPTTPAAGSVTLAALPKGWVTLASAKGSGGAQSTIFHLQDHNTRLRYTSSGGSLTVFVVDAKRGLDATAGFAAADCAGVCTEGWMSLHNPAGDYYLLVQASGGRWAVDISEYSGTVG